MVQNPPVVQGLLNDNYYSSVTPVEFYAKFSPVPHVVICEDVQFVNVLKPVTKIDATHVHTVSTNGQPQKNGPIPVQVQKHVRDVSSVNQSLFAPNVPLAALPPHMGWFWQVWPSLGSSPRVLSILKEGYTLPFQIKPPLSRFPLILSGYAKPLRNSYLKEASEEWSKWSRFSPFWGFTNSII